MGEWPYFPSASVMKMLTGDTTITTGTLLSIPGSTNTKGAWTELNPSIPFNCSGLIFFINAASNSGYQRRFFIDLAIGPSGNEQIIVSNFFHMFAVNVGTVFAGKYMYIPVTIPEGVRLSARYQYNNSEYIRCIAYGIPSSWNDLQSYSKCISLGEDLSTTNGTFVNNPGSEAYSSWVELTTSTTEDIKGLCINAYSDDRDDTHGFAEIGIGPLGSETVLIARHFVHSIGISVYDDMPINLKTWMFNTFIPQGTRIVTRTKVFGHNGNDMYVFLNGLV